MVKRLSTLLFAVSFCVLVIFSVAPQAGAAEAGGNLGTNNIEEGWFTCHSCELFTEVIGIVAAATIIAADPESAAAEEAMSVIYDSMDRHYGAPSHMNMDKFIEETKDFLGPLSVAKFVVLYPKFVCHLFGKCDRPN